MFRKPNDTTNININKNFFWYQKYQWWQPLMPSQTYIQENPQCTTNISMLKALTIIANMISLIKQQFFWCHVIKQFCRILLWWQMRNVSIKEKRLQKVTGSYSCEWDFLNDMSDITTLLTDMRFRSWNISSVNSKQSGCWNCL